jgi:hypothetical protein
MGGNTQKIFQGNWLKNWSVNLNCITKNMQSLEFWYSKCWMSAEFQNNHVYGTPKGSQKCKKKKKKKSFVATPSSGKI